MKIIDNIYNQPERLQKILDTEGTIADSLIKLVQQNISPVQVLAFMLLL